MCETNFDKLWHAVEHHAKCAEIRNMFELFLIDPTQPVADDLNPKYCPIPSELSGWMMLMGLLVSFYFASFSHLLSVDLIHVVSLFVPERSHKRSCTSNGGPSVAWLLLVRFALVSSPLSLQARAAGLSAQSPLISTHSCLLITCERSVQCPTTPSWTSLFKIGRLDFAFCRVDTDFPRGHTFESVSDIPRGRVRAVVELNGTKRMLQ